MTRTDDEQPNRSAHPLNQRNYRSIVDQQIAEAVAAGDFTNLPGQGRPIDLNDDAHVAEDDRLGHRMLKSNGFTPAWMEARRDIDSERQKLERWLADANASWQRANETRRGDLRREFRAKLIALRSSILSYNLTVPASVGQMPGIQLDKELARLGIGG